MSKAAVHLFLLVMLLLPLASCSRSSPIESVGSDSTLATRAPSTENTTAVEQPLPAGGGNPAIKAAPLPVGGNEDGGPCLGVSWSGDSIPDGVGAVIKSVDFEPDTYQRADSQCAQTPACIDHVLRASDTRCFVGIEPTNSAATGRDPVDPVSVTVQGYVVLSAWLDEEDRVIDGEDCCEAPSGEAVVGVRRHGAHAPAWCR